MKVYVLTIVLTVLFLVGLFVFRQQLAQLPLWSSLVAIVVLCGVMVWMFKIKP